MDTITKKDKMFCDHDYKNAIDLGAGNYFCPLCKELVNPLEWFLVNECGCTFISSFAPDEKVTKKGGARKKLEKRIGKSIVTKNNYLKKPQDKKLLK